MAAWIQKWSKCLWTRSYSKRGSSFVPISKIGLRTVAWFSKVQYSEFFANQVSEHGFRSSSRHSEGSTLECGRGTPGSGRAAWGSLWHIPRSQISMGFYPEGAQKQTPKLCKANQGATGEGSFRSAPDPKINASTGAASGYFAETITWRDQGLCGYSPLSFVTRITGKKSLNQNTLRWWVRGFWMKQLPYTGRSAQSSPFSSTPH